MQRRIWKQIHQTQNWASSHSTLSHKQCESSTWDVTYPSPVFAAWTHYGFPETWVGKDHKFVYFSPFLLLNSLLQYSHKMVIEWRVKLLCCVRLFATPWTVAHQAPPSMGFSRQEYWSGVPLPSPLQSIALQIVGYNLASEQQFQCSFYCTGVYLPWTYSG